MRSVNESHHRAKHSNETVQAIRELRERKGMSYSALAVMFGLSMWTIRDYCEYRTRP